MLPQSLVVGTCCPVRCGGVRGKAGGYERGSPQGSTSERAVPSLSRVFREDACWGYPGSEPRCSLPLQITKPSMSSLPGTRRLRYTSWWHRRCRSGRSKGIQVPHTGGGGGPGLRVPWDRASAGDAAQGLGALTAQGLACVPSWCALITETAGSLKVPAPTIRTKARPNPR